MQVQNTLEDKLSLHILFWEPIIHRMFVLSDLLS